MNRLLPLLVCSVLALACGTRTQVIDAPGTMAVDATSLDFGTVLVGGTSAASFQVQNQSRVAGRLSVKLDGPYTLATTSTLGTLAPGAIARVDIEFHPTDAAASPGTATVSVEGLETQATIALTGQGTRPSLQTESVVDFGDVPIGQTVHHDLIVTSQSLVTLSVKVALKGADAADFTAGSSSMLLAPGASATLDLSFTPLLLDAQGATLELTPCVHCDPVQVPLRGNGQTQDLDVSPTQIAFGHVSVGMTALHEVRLVNTQTEGAWVDSIHLIDGPDSPFVVEDAPQTPFLLGVNPVTFHVSFSPRGRLSYDAAVVVEGVSKVVRIGLSGVGGDGGLTVSPAQLDMGLVPGGPTVKAVVHVGDAGSGAPLTLTNAQISGDTDNVFTASTQLLPATLRGSGVDVTVAFRTTLPGPHQAFLSLSVTDGATDFQATVPLSGLAGSGASCQLDVKPTEIRMGLVGVGRTASRTLHLSNTGATACTIDGFGIDGPGSFRLLDAPGQSTDIAPGGRLDVTVQYEPMAPGVAREEASLHFVKASSASPEVTVPLSGLGSQLDFGPVAPANFGTVPVSATALLALDLNNVTGPVVRIDDQSLAGPTALGLLVPTPAIVPEGESATAQLSFHPLAAGPYEALYELNVADAIEPVIVPVTGVAEQKPCGSACTSPQASCPGARNTWVVRDVLLAGAASPPTGRKATCAWSVTSAPAGSTATPVTAGTCSSTFRPDVRGDYDLQLSVSDDAGGSASCTTTVHADTLPAIWVEATWNPAQLLDLHLFHPSAGSPNTPSTWRSSPYDCWKGDAAPAWDGPESDDNPRLDPGPPGGPEVVRLKTASRTHDYTVGVHRPTSRNDATHVKVDVYCSGKLVTTTTGDLSQAYQALVLGSIHVNADGSCNFTSQQKTLTVMP